MYRVVEWLSSGRQDQQYQASLALRTLAAQAPNKPLIREAGGIQQLVELLDSRAETPLTVVAAETLSCLVADDPVNRELLRHYGGIDKLVGLLTFGPDSECTHRALLALRILTDKEPDRLAILKSGGIEPLVQLLNSGPESEITEYAAAALGNLAAGSQQIKDALREAGAIPPLVRLLRDDPDEVSAELSAVVLRNLSLQNPVNRQEIQDADGLHPLLQLLSTGQEKLHYPLSCNAEYLEVRTREMKRKTAAGYCCFDPVHGHLCLSVRDPSKMGCFAQGSNSCNPRDRNAERYSLLRKLTITEPDSRTLELNFTAPERQGALRLTPPGKSSKNSSKRLQRIIIYPCPATEIKGSIMRMLTRMHLEREFRMTTDPPLSQRAAINGSSHPASPRTSNNERANQPVPTRV